MQAYVELLKDDRHHQSNTAPGPIAEVVLYAAYEAFTRGRSVRIWRAAPVTPGLTGRQMLEREESYLTDELLAEFTP